ncbi:hypothetical protein LP090_00145 [Moraxella bovis]|uniref:hypothetical protein n=1 Tax=Moraxella bovis TaxID=476 RepID=UPI0022276218|nr:hypothetical protein [Moraxella bovis]UYZ68527.1 hypothetical protein LP122_12435 [Moraxella bovis]UYZ70898.1 hypothetical protein LP089_12525 [Moraxella bovis]UYZ73180.1 hypothetical protein LP105_00145 [Moraxella bovis]UZA14203.1 hypothetical protein LP102_12610 [Moraxella bovis]UZA27440.1 hypothetical protein LP119_00145 [Moraxella bovis]
MAFPDESYGVVVAWDDETKTGWVKDECMCKNELVFLDNENSLNCLRLNNEYPKIGDCIEYIIFYETEPPYNPYMNGARKFQLRPPMFTEQELQEMKEQHRRDNIIHKFGKMVWFLYIGSIIFCVLLLVFMWAWSLFV